MKPLFPVQHRNASSETRFRKDGNRLSKHSFAEVLGAAVFRFGYIRNGSDDWRPSERTAGAPRASKTRRINLVVAAIIILIYLSVTSYDHMMETHKEALCCELLRGLG